VIAATLSTLALHYDYDVVLARRRARDVAEQLGFDNQDRTRIATVTSEIARNALRYAGGGEIQFSVDEREAKPCLVITVSDRGKGIADLQSVLDGRYQSSTGMGVGITGARRLMDTFEVRSDGSGTTVVMTKCLAATAPDMTSSEVARVVSALAQPTSESALDEIQRQNAELLAALEALNERQTELQRLNQELEDTNRGVLALYAELDEKAESLRRADNLKTRFLSDMSHEFRTPVNSILALARLLEEADLDEEQRKQLGLIRRAADDLANLVNDLLDLSKIEAGKVDVRPAEFEVANLFSALRGMLRPLLLSRSIALVFDEPEGLPPVYSDEGKISQILRNFISNALKFTESGEVRTSASLGERADTIVFNVVDTGIGIAAEDHERIFEEFTQLEHPLQRRYKGSGLGLPLTRKLAALLDGRVGVESKPGVGSRFWVEIPIRLKGAAPERTPITIPAMREVTAAGEERAMRVLVIDDDETARYTIGSFAARPGVEIVEADSGAQGIARAQGEPFDVILLDLMMPGIGGHEVLQRLKGDPATAAIPVVIVTSRFVNDDEKQQILQRATAVIYKGDLSREVVSKAIEDAVGA
jgi:signal transduction histidine kinase